MFTPRHPAPSTTRDTGHQEITNPNTHQTHTTITAIMHHRSTRRCQTIMEMARGMSPFTRTTISRQRIWRTRLRRLLDTVQIMDGTTSNMLRRTMHMEGATGRGRMIRGVVKAEGTMEATTVTPCKRMMLAASCSMFHVISRSFALSCCLHAPIPSPSTHHPRSPCFPRTYLCCSHHYSCSKFVLSLSPPPVLEMKSSSVSLLIETICAMFGHGW